MYPSLILCSIVFGWFDSDLRLSFDLTLPRGCSPTKNEWQLFSHISNKMLWINSKKKMQLYLLLSGSLAGCKVAPLLGWEMPLYLTESDGVGGLLEMSRNVIFFIIKTL